jgi:hypothetical protein
LEPPLEQIAVASFGNRHSRDSSVWQFAQWRNLQWINPLSR